MKVLFLGTPHHSAECLKFLIDSGVEIVAVVTQPDRPFGRSLAIRQPPVKELAIECGIPVLQPEKASSEKIIAELSLLKPDITAVFAFGEFLSDAFINIPKISTINLHLSLLPKYRGAAPVQWAIIEGEKTTGVTTFHIVKEMDAGDLIYQETAPVFDDDTAATLMNRLTEIGARLLKKTIDALYNGSAPRIPQDHSLASRARRLKKTDGHIDWSLCATRICNLIRGTNPWPCAYSFCTIHQANKMIKLLSAEPVDIENGTPGMIFCSSNEVLVYTGDGAVKILSAQLEGRCMMSGTEFLNGHREIMGSILR